VECAFFLHNLIEKSLASVEEETIKAAFRLNGTQRIGRVGFLRFDKGRIKREGSDEMFGVAINVGINVVDVNVD
jgi:hypothetical protein